MVPIGSASGSLIEHGFALQIMTPHAMTRPRCLWIQKCSKTPREDDITEHTVRACKSRGTFMAVLIILAIRMGFETTVRNFTADSTRHVAQAHRRTST
jgi:hypothetical protein